MASISVSTVSGKCQTSNPASCQFNAAFFAKIEAQIKAGTRTTVKQIAADFSMTPVAARSALVKHYGMSDSKFIIGFTKGRTGGITLSPIA